jgi:hypothetical protein
VNRIVVQGSVNGSDILQHLWGNSYLLREPPPVLGASTACASDRVIKTLLEANGQMVAKRGNKRGIPNGAEKGGDVPGSEAAWEGHPLVFNQLL